MDSVLVVGGGSWGTAFADYLARRGMRTCLWAREEEVLAAIRSDRENRLFLPGVRLDDRLDVSADLEGEADRAGLWVLAVPSKFMRAVLGRLRGSRRGEQVLVCLSKGFEADSLKTMSQVAADVLGAGVAGRWLTLSGPSFARELAAGHPTAVVAAGEDDGLLGRVQEGFSSPTLRVYRSADLRGLEVAGALKNVMAIASGMINGLGFGYNTTASMVTRANLEISRLGVRLGGRPETFWGLAGVGDLMLTCFGTLSRNFQLGRRIALGETLAAVERSTPMVAEGVETAKAVRRLAAQLGIEMPIADAVHRVLFEGRDAGAAVAELMTRSLKSEWTTS